MCQAIRKNNFLRLVAIAGRRFNCVCDLSTARAAQLIIHRLERSPIAVDLVPVPSPIRAVKKFGARSLPRALIARAMVHADRALDLLASKGSTRRRTIDGCAHVARSDLPRRARV